MPQPIVPTSQEAMFFMANQLTKKMNTNVIRKGFWAPDRFKSEPWMDGMGDTYRNVSFNTSVVEAQWTNIDMNTSSYDIQTNLNIVGSTEYNTSRASTRLKSGLVDMQALRTRYDYPTQVQNILTQLMSNVGNVWSSRMRELYVASCTYKMVVTANGFVGDSPTDDITSFPEIEPEGTLNTALINQAYEIAMQEHASTAPFGVAANGAPIFVMVCERELTDWVRTNVAERDDIRYANMGKGTGQESLLQQIGATYTFKNFVFTTDTMSRRYKFDDTKPVGQKYVEISPYVRNDAGATTGARWDVNPAYRSARIGEAIVFSPDVMVNLVPATITSANRATFKAENPTGVIDWVNNPDMDKNPLGLQGFFLATLSNGRKLEFPRRGMVIRYLRGYRDGDIVNPFGQTIGNANNQFITDAQSASL